MAEVRQTYREAVGVLPDVPSLEAAIDDLLSAGFDRADISLLATREAIDGKPGQEVERVEELEDDPSVPRWPYVSREGLGAGEGGLIGGLAHIPAVTAAGAVVVTGGALAPAILAGIGAGGAGAAAGAVLARWLGNRYAESYEKQLERGGLLLWVNTREPEDERRATEILSRHGGRDVHVHDMPASTRPESAPGM